MSEYLPRLWPRPTILLRRSRGTRTHENERWPQTSPRMLQNALKYLATPDYRAFMDYLSRYRVLQPPFISRCIGFTPTEISATTPLVFDNPDVCIRCGGLRTEGTEVSDIEDLCSVLIVCLLVHQSVPMARHENYCAR